jgi:hypothetical protein
VEKKKVKFKELSIWFKILIILGVLVLFGFFRASSSYEEAKDCIDQCISEEGWCISDSYFVYDKSGGEYISLNDADMCNLDLESCANYCWD